MAILNKDIAVKWLEEHARSSPQHECATYVRKALEAGGMNTADRPQSAKDYGPFLKSQGFIAVQPDSYFPQKGDIAVIQNYPGGNVNGHIGMYTGSRWVSDFRQQDIWGGSGYRTEHPALQVYRL